MIITMQTFNTIDKATIKNSRGLGYLEFRDHLKPRFALVWADILAGYLALAIIVWGAVYAQKHYPGFWLLTISIAAFFIGYVVAYLNLFMHEASHYNIAGDKKTNDLLANIFLGLLVGMHIEFYRKMHFVHHRLLGTKEDSEKSYFDAITLRFIIESLTGIRVIKVLSYRNKDIKLNEGTGQGEEIIKKNNRVFAAAAFLNLCFVAALFLSGYWQIAAAWVIGFGAVFPFFATFRQILEHRREDALATTNYHEVDHGAAHRMFGDGPIASTMGPAGFNRHLIHHWDPQVSYTRFKEVEEFLKDTPLKDEIQRSQTTYFKTFVSLLNS